MNEQTEAPDAQLPRGRGRPRSSALDEEIRAAAWQQIAEVGCTALTIEAIAQQVGCSRSTLYRRFATKAELISHLLDQTALAFAPQVSADVPPRDWIIAHAVVCAEMYAHARGAALIQILATARFDPAIAQAVAAHGLLVEPYYYAPMARLAPGASDRAIKLALHGLIGSILHHVATRQDQLSLEEIGKMVDAAIGLARA